MCDLVSQLGKQTKPKRTKRRCFAPGLMYHPHERPLSTPLAVLLNTTSSLPLPIISTPSLPRLSSLSSSLSTPPIHVDHVAECVLRSIEHEHVRGVVDSREMRRWVGLDEAKLGEEVLKPLSWEGGQRGGHGKVHGPGVASAGQVRSYSTRSGMRVGGGMARGRVRSGIAGSVGGVGRVGPRRFATIYAPGPGGKEEKYIIEPSSNQETPAQQNTSEQEKKDMVIDAAPANGNGSNGDRPTGKSRHPYANLNNANGSASPDIDSLPNPLATLPTPNSIPTGDATAPHSLAPSGAVISTFPSSPTPSHPFDTHAFVNHMETSGFSQPISRTIMRAVRDILIARSTEARSALLHKEDTENAAYLFRAALSELRTELNVRARNDGLTLRSATNLIRREVDTLNQKMKEDVNSLKHE